MLFGCVKVLLLCENNFSNRSSVNIDTKKEKRELPLHNFLTVKATAPSFIL